MNISLTIQEKLQDLRNEKKLTLAELSEATGIPVPTLQRIENIDDYHASYQDIRTLAKFYDVSADYLMGFTNYRKECDYPIDKLNLDDKTVQILASSKLNNRLVCELLTHDEFQQLLTAIEIYIDRKIVPQMNSLNAMYKFMEKTITDNFKVSSRDEIINFLQQSVIDEDEYLRYRISERFNSIMKSLFDAHKKDTAPIEQLPFVSEIEKDTQTYLDNKDNPAKGKLIILAKQIGLNLTKLSDDEIFILIKALEKSEISKRNRRK